jgi:hypothetical protein
MLELIIIFFNATAATRAHRTACAAQNFDLCPEFVKFFLDDFFLSLGA